MLHPTLPPRLHDGAKPYRRVGGEAEKDGARESIAPPWKSDRIGAQELPLPGAAGRALQIAATLVLAIAPYDARLRAAAVARRDHGPPHLHHLTGVEGDRQAERAEQKRDDCRHYDRTAEHRVSNLRREQLRDNRHGDGQESFMAAYRRGADHFTSTILSGNLIVLPPTSSV